MTRKKNRNEEPKFNNHHLMPQSLNGSNESPNVERWRKYYHDALHAIFGNDHTQEKLGRIVSLDEAILTERFKGVIEDILSMSPQDIYKIEAFKNKSCWKNLK